MGAAAQRLNKCTVPVDRPDFKPGEGCAQSCVG